LHGSDEFLQQSQIAIGEAVGAGVVERVSGDDIGRLSAEDRQPPRSQPGVLIETAVIST
jgi:hypothetical protein